MSENSGLDRSISVENEDAYVEIGRMKDVSKIELQGVTVYSGYHPEYQHGVHIVIPIVGSAIVLLPFEHQSELLYKQM
jgi:hypothetical protein